MKKKVEQDGHAQFMRNLWKFRRNLRKFRTCPEVPDIPEKFAKSKLKIKYFKMLLQFLSMESMMIKMKTMKINCVRKKTSNQFKDNDSYHTQECTKAFNATIRRGGESSFGRSQWKLDDSVSMVKLGLSELEKRIEE